MYNFCTLFDSNYLSRGITLYRSLERHCDSFHLYVFAFDTLSLNVLKQLGLSHATIISLEEFETPELLSIKSTRTRAEYCWTSTSSTILYVLDRYRVDHCTYLDADMMFFSSPKPIFDEMKDSSIIITEHRYSPRYNKEALTGTYCVQFVTFKNDERGVSALRWWRDRCIEWCYARFEDGKFGDQKYLDDWLTRFKGVHVLHHRGGGMAAWNVQQYDLFEKKSTLCGRELATGNEFPVIFYHFHYLRFLSNDMVELGRRELTRNVLRLLYRPYLIELENAKRKIQSINASFDPHGTVSNNRTWKTPLLFMYRKLLGVYHIYSLESLLSKES